MNITDYAAKRKQEERIRQNVRHLTNMQALDRAAKKAKSTAEKYANEAISAEHAGNHQNAVKFAVGANLMKRETDQIEKTKITIETMHILDQCSRAINDAARAGSEVIGGLVAGPEKMAESQAAYLMAQERFKEISESGSYLYDSCDDDDEVNAAGEACLKELLGKQENDNAQKLKARLNKVRKEINIT